MDFTKMTGAGNDFIVLEADSGLVPAPGTIRQLCDRRYGIGADGLMILQRLKAADAGEDNKGTSSAFCIDFYNADGSGGMLCGNGARCALVYAAGRGFISYGKQVSFSFAGRLYSGTALAADRARFMLTPRYTTRLETGIESGAASASGRYIDLGSLHLVVDLADLAYENSASRGSNQASRLRRPSLETLDIATIGASLRNHERFAPEGVNVNFCSLIDGKLHVRTFERGVEGETLACGTGSTASALSYALRGLVEPPVQVVTRSGEELIIDFDEAARPSRLSLEGPATVVFDGRIDIPNLLENG